MAPRVGTVTIEVGEVWNPGWGDTVGSTCPRPLARSVAILDRPDGHLTLAHELGHVLGLDHAPAGTAKGADPDYPDPDGHLECAGFDLDTMAPVDPRRFHDLMGYGPEDRQWISAYSWCRALARLTLERTPAGPGPSPESK